MPKHAVMTFAFALFLAGAGQALAKVCPPHSHQESNGAGAAPCVCDKGYSKTAASPTCVWSGIQK